MTQAVLKGREERTMHEHTYRFYIRQGEFELDVEGDRNFVESYVAAFLAGEAQLNAGKKKRAIGGATGRKRKAALPEKSSGVSINKAALQEYVKGKKLSSDGKKYVAFTAFLKSQGVAEVNAVMIRDCYKALDLPYKPTSRQNLFLMKKSGKVAAGSAPGMYVLTEKGEQEASVLGGKSKKAKAVRKKAGKRRKTRRALPAKKSAR